MNKKNPFSHHTGYSSFGAGKSEQNSSMNQEYNTHDLAPEENQTETSFFQEENHLKDLFPEEPIENIDSKISNASPQESLAMFSDEDLTESCKERICPKCPVKKEAEDTHLRALADLENTKKRLIKEREEMKRFATESVLTDIIPALDNLNLALQYAPTEGAGKDFVMGVEMTRKLMLEALKKHGLEEVGQIGEPFDPALHEAVGVANVEAIPVDHVCNLLSKGYSLQGRLLRPARVTVCKR